MYQQVTNTNTRGPSATRTSALVRILVYLISNIAVMRRRGQRSEQLDARIHFTDPRVRPSVSECGYGLPRPIIDSRKYEVSFWDHFTVPKKPQSILRLQPPKSIKIDD
ncbi:hypothetical protein N7510_002652 [Penicillium lagena]|uniref:uncharacterized protein n=1 Tax=Penicillium lagena TaxID=94218 RepID=UPI002540738F|nr:uncharacterized protein N7510_002652 [Penicillium lagena]KAJ5626343.1 hypothetical protein N7510_002652 [Penicillium lagena]